MIRTVYAELHERSESRDNQRIAHSLWRRESAPARQIH
jgi:hypothetical protein